MKMLEYSKALIAGDDREANIKHFIIFMTAMHYFIASFMILFGVVRHTVDKDMMTQIMENDFYIICVGIGVLTVENAVQALAERAKVLTSVFRSKKTVKDSGDVITEEENVEAKPTAVKADVVNTENIETVNTNTTNTNTIKSAND